MFKSSIAVLSLLVLIVVPSTLWADVTWQIVARSDNDLVRVLNDVGAKVHRFDDAATAILQAPEGAGLLVLADGYPTATTQLSTELYDQARKRKLRLYVEYPSSVASLKLGDPQTLKTGHWGNILQRTVVASDAFGDALRKNRILMIHDCHYLPVEASFPHLVVAQVAGYDDALYGLPPSNVHPILFEHPDGGVLVATTKLSQFVTGRYAPLDAWEPVWQMILQWAEPSATVPSLRWLPTVRPSFSREEALPVDVERLTLLRGAEWFQKSGLLVTPTSQTLYDLPSNQGPPTEDWPDGHRAAPARREVSRGDGSLGLLEGFVRRSTTMDRNPCCGGDEQTMSPSRPARWPWRG